MNSGKTGLYLNKWPVFFLVKKKRVPRGRHMYEVIIAFGFLVIVSMKTKNPFLTDGNNISRPKNVFFSIIINSKLGGNNNDNSIIKNSIFLMLFCLGYTMDIGTMMLIGRGVYLPFVVLLSCGGSFLLAFGQMFAGKKLWIWFSIYLGATAICNAIVYMWIDGVLSAQVGKMEYHIIELFQKEYLVCTILLFAVLCMLADALQRNIGQPWNGKPLQHCIVTVFMGMAFFDALLISSYIGGDFQGPLSAIVWMSCACGICMAISATNGSIQSAFVCGTTCFAYLIAETYL